MKKTVVDALGTDVESGAAAVKGAKRDTFGINTLCLYWDNIYYNHYNVF